MDMPMQPPLANRIQTSINKVLSDKRIHPTFISKPSESEAAFVIHISEAPYHPKQEEIARTIRREIKKLYKNFKPEEDHRIFGQCQVTVLRRIHNAQINREEDIQIDTFTVSSL